MRNARLSADEEVLDHRVRPSLSPYEVKAGSLLPAVLITQANSDLPGQLIAQVPENVFDSATGATCSSRRAPVRSASTTASSPSARSASSCSAPSAPVSRSRKAPSEVETRPTDPAALLARRARVPPLAARSGAESRAERMIVTPRRQPPAGRLHQTARGMVDRSARLRSCRRFWAALRCSARSSSPRLAAGSPGSPAAVSFARIRRRAGSARALRTRWRALRLRGLRSFTPLASRPARLTPTRRAFSLRGRPPASGPVRPGLRMG